MTGSRQHPLLRVLVVDDDSFTRTTLKSTLAALDCKVVAEADAAGAALRMVAKARPDVALLDLDLGEGPTGIDLAHALRRSLPEIGIVMLSAYEEPRLMGAGQQPLPERSLYLVKRTITDAEQLGRALRLSIDPELGRVLMVGAGGIWAEVLDDVGFLALPASRQEITDLIGRLKIAPILAGARGQGPLDVAAAVEVIWQIGQQFLVDGWVAEVDINPLRVRALGRGAVALDTLVLAQGDV